MPSLRSGLVVVLVASCARSPAPASSPPSSPSSWPVPATWRSELIPFPLDFAPSLAHHGVEEIRFAPGFFDPAAAGYWSYTFVWRVDEPAMLDATTLGAELTTYFRGLIDAVDDKHEITDRDSIVVHAAPDASRFALTAHVVDAFKTKQPLELAGSAVRRACGAGAIWVVVLAPVHATLRSDLDALAARATCEQRPVSNKR